MPPNEPIDKCRPWEVLFELKYLFFMASFVPFSCLSTICQFKVEKTIQDVKTMIIFVTKCDVLQGLWYVINFNVLFF